MKSAERTVAAEGNPPNQSPKAFQDTAQAVDAAGHRKSCPTGQDRPFGNGAAEPPPGLASAVPKGRGGNNESNSCSSINVLRRLYRHLTKIHITDSALGLPSRGQRSAVNGDRKKNDLRVCFLESCPAWHSFLLPIFLLYSIFDSCCCLIFRASAIVATL
jgi:hypothetical protein